MSLSRHLPVLLLPCLLAACASHAPTSVPSAQRSGQGWVVTRTAVAARITQACPDGIADGIQDLYAPSRDQIDALEARLAALDDRLPQASSADRQYVGILRDGQPYIFVRGLPARDYRKDDPARTLLGDCHSGWEALYNPATGQFDDARALDAATVGP